MKNLNGDLSREGFDLLTLRALEAPRAVSGPIRDDVICWMPIARGSRWVVTIDGRPYAGYERHASALEAKAGWQRGWPAVQGRTLAVVRWRDGEAS